jgi:putative tryptophan/tyrosine transport system substrate-binding protein
MKRRDFITLVGGAAAAWPLAARAQPTGKVARVGFLGASLDNPVAGPAYKYFLSELQKLGFTEGQNLVVEYRRMDEGTPKAFAAANELGAAKVEVLVADGPEISLQAAAAVRPGVPIVMLAINYDPIAGGYMSSLAHPGGNVTGVMFRQPELSVKQLELLAEAFPDRTRVGALWDLLSADQFAAAERAARSMRLSLRPLKLENPPYDFDRAFQMMVQDEVKMLLVLSSAFFTPYRVHIAELAIRHGLPSMFIFKAYVEAGGLMSYGVDTLPQYRRAASYVAKILRGAHPSDLPVEEVDNFEFALNLKTAKAIGVVLPTSILLRADQVIE